MKKSQNISSRRIAASCAITALLFTGYTFYLDHWGQADRAHKADAIVVLGARVKPDGTPGISLRRRALQAAALYKRGLANHIITTGGIGENAPAEAVVSARFLRENGVPQSAILTEETSTSTWENAVNARRICRAHGWKKVIVVSEPFHLWRATRYFHHLGIKALPSPTPNRTLRLRLAMTCREVPLLLRDVFLLRV